VPHNAPQPNTPPPRDRARDEDGPHSSQDIPRDRANDARERTTGQRSEQKDPDSADADIDRDDFLDER
jgi:hypothetical protein